MPDGGWIAWATSGVVPTERAPDERQHLSMLLPLARRLTGCSAARGARRDATELDSTCQRCVCHACLVGLHV